MTKKILIATIILVLLAGVVTATVVLFLFPYQPEEPPMADETGATEEGRETVVEANNQFTFDLYKQLSKNDDGNIFYSPYSISAALAMTYEGAKGKTAEEIQSVFHFPETNILRPNFAAIYNEINEENAEHELKTGNALWIQHDFPLLEEYLEKVENYYGGKAALLDFVNAVEQSRQTINSFIEEQTNGKIEDLIPAGYLNNMTRLVLTNAIYFKGTWQWQFDEADTQERIFRISDTETVETPMMYMNPEDVEFDYAQTDGLQILELPYKGDKISMLILLPEENLEAIDPYLTAEKIEEYKSQMRPTELSSISLPKFEFDTKYFMSNILSELGMPTAFLDSADFSGITGRKDLFISEVIHQAYVKVDEEGTEAAAATAVVMELSAILINDFNADHPFIFIIQEKESGNILFLGRVTDPTELSSTS
jgi:serine protease inhibitor